MPTVGCEADAVAFTEEDACSSSSSCTSTEGSSAAGSTFICTAEGSYSSGRNGRLPIMHDSCSMSDRGGLQTVHFTATPPNHARSHSYRLHIPVHTLVDSISYNAELLIKQSPVLICSPSYAYSNARRLATFHTLWLEMLPAGPQQLPPIGDGTGPSKFSIEHCFVLPGSTSTASGTGLAPAEATGNGQQGSSNVSGSSSSRSRIRVKVVQQFRKDWSKGAWLLAAVDLHKEW